MAPLHHQFDIGKCTDDSSLQLEVVQYQAHFFPNQYSSEISIFPPLDRIQYKWYHSSKNWRISGRHYTIWQNLNMFVWWKRPYSSHDQYWNIWNRSWQLQYDFSNRFQHRSNVLSSLSLFPKVTFSLYQIIFTLR